MKKYGNEFKVGLFIILCILGLVYITFRTGKVSLKKDGYRLYVSFDEIAGLGKKAPVMLNGFEVGKVEDVKLSYDAGKTLITLKLWLDKDVLIREGSSISIKTLGLMGEKYIQITSSQSDNFLKPDTTLNGKPYADIDTLIASLNTTMDENKDRITSITKNFE